MGGVEGGGEGEGKNLKWTPTRHGARCGLRSHDRAKIKSWDTLKKKKKGVGRLTNWATRAP